MTFKILWKLLTVAFVVVATNSPQPALAEENFDQIVADGGYYQLKKSELKKFIESSVPYSEVSNLSIHWSSKQLIPLRSYHYRKVSFTLKHNTFKWVDASQRELLTITTVYSIRCSLTVGDPYQVLSMKNCRTDPQVDRFELFGLLKDYTEVRRIQ